MKKALGLVIVLAGCATPQQATDRAQAFATAAFVGQDVTAFFSLHGLPSARHVAGDGSVLFEWQSDVRSYQLPGHVNTTSYRSGNTVQTVGTVTPGPNVSTFCRARITTTDKGVITAFRITADTVGEWAMSRCGEVLK